MPGGLRDLTSTELQSRIANGEAVQDQLPDVVENFVGATGAFRPVYNLRSRLLDRLYSVRAWAEKECDFEALIRIAGEETDRGENLRGMLRSANMSSSQLKDLVSDILKFRST